MINGIPVMLCYVGKGNIAFIPDKSITGSSPNDLDNLDDLDNFVKWCGCKLEM